jgi:hypothetical protein
VKIPIFLHHSGCRSLPRCLANSPLIFSPSAYRSWLSCLRGPGLISGVWANINNSQDVLDVLGTWYKSAKIVSFVGCTGGRVL